MLGLIYVSNATAAFSPQSLCELASHADNRNRKMQITGFLYYEKQQFLQYIEGPEENVVGLMAKIERDQRHHVIKQLQQSDLIERRFPNWFMRWLREDEMIQLNMEHVIKDQINFMTSTGEETDYLQDYIWGSVDRYVQLVKRLQTNTWQEFSNDTQS